MDKTAAALLGSSFTILAGFCAPSGWSATVIFALVALDFIISAAHKKTED